MGQVKLYGLKDNFSTNKQAISNAIHEAVVNILAYPADKKFHRFIALNPDEFFFPDDRSQNYIIIEISMFAGREKETKSALINQLFRNINSQVGITPQDVEITLFETTKENWDIRGLPGDELLLGYKVTV